MSGRDLESAVLAEIVKDQTFPFYLMEIQFDPDPITHVDNTVRLTTAYGDILWGGETWNAVGHFLSFTSVKETAENRITKMQVSLSAIDQSNISTFFTVEYMNRPLLVYLGFIDVTDYTVLVDPVLIFNGLMSQPLIQEDPTKNTSVISVEVVDHWESFNIRPGRHTNSDEQQAFFPGDLGFEFVSKVPHALKWGAPE